MSVVAGGLLRKYSPKNAPVESVACTSDGRRLVVGYAASDKPGPTLLVLDLDTGTPARTVEEGAPFENAVWHLVVDRNDRFVFYLRQTKSRFALVRFDLHTGEKRILEETEESDLHLGFAIGPGNELVLGDGKEIRFHDVATWKVLRSLPARVAKGLAGDPHLFTSLAISPDGTSLAAGGLGKGVVQLFDLRKGKAAAKVSAKMDFPRQLVFDPTGSYLFILDFFLHGLFIRDLARGRWFQPDVYGTNWQGTSCAAFPPGKPQQVVMGMKSGVVSMVDFASYDEVFHDKLHKGRVHGVLVTPDGTRLVSWSEDGQIIVRRMD